MEGCLPSEAGGDAEAAKPRGSEQIEEPGFKKRVKTDVVLHVQDALALDFEMALGAESETVNV